MQQGQVLFIYIILVSVLKVSKLILLRLLLSTHLERAQLLKTFIAVASHNVYQFNTADEKQGLIHDDLLSKT